MRAVTWSGPAARRHAGFSLVELMIAIVIGFIVTGSVLAFTVMTVRSYGENIRSTRLTNDLSSAMNLVAGELRRAGYDASSVGRLFTDETPSSFESVVVNGSCLAYRYDRGIGALGDTPAATEMRAFRLDSDRGSLQMDASSSSAGCSAGGTWVDLTDPELVNITAFAPSIEEIPFCSVVDQRPADPADPTGPQVFDRVEGAIREVRLSLTGSLRADPSVSRSIENASRVRADRIAFITSSNSACP